MITKVNLELFHRLEGDLIYFKPISTDDTEAVHSYASDMEVKRFIGWNLMKNIEETRAYIEELVRREAAGNHLYASIVLKSTHEVIGTAMIFGFDHGAKHAEIGYLFNKNHWGKGYATEAIKLMSDFAFETMDLHKLHAQVVEANTGSSRALEKNGFIVEGRLKDYYFIEGNYYDKLILGKL
ncbi:GNAT family N-acetyltransferase [Alkaliphilus hydrothermalis]|uniref:Ribosomal-protein-alanine N-acetyltransferase n=1 Tax=Alkaliphilus hydrothermalis TaxID=1482730 RepID=A0ABS2NSX3_9FIRM|nr:GNAT family N-acetyltransferase [Alkaliphilus hydrothermalis]MBM7616053.1 ribosomal-protein-alanine N-acetyltransferase [Alkaliphilus hydrothermalis]